MILKDIDGFVPTWKVSDHKPKETDGYEEGFDDGVLFMMDMLYNAPTVDAIEVVRCGKCMHYHWEFEPCHGKTIHYCDLPHMEGIEIFREFFCYYGKRRDDNNDKTKID